MSIIAVVDLAPIARNLFLPVLIALFVGFGSAAGVFRINSINGPSRLDLAQPVGNLLWTTVGGLTALFAATFVGQLAIIAGHRIVTHSTNDTLATPELLLIDLFSRVAVVAVILAIMARFGLNFRRMGVSSPRILPGLAKAVAGIFIVMPLMVLVMQVLEWALERLNHGGDHIHELLQELGDSTRLSVKLLIVFSAVVMAPLSEELFFRGCLQTMIGTALGRWWRRHIPLVAATPSGPEIQGVMVPREGPLPYAAPSVDLGSGGQDRPPAQARWAAVLITSALFALVHPLWSAPAIFVLAICLGYAYERTGNLWTSIFIHATFNAIEVALFLYLAG